MAKKEITYELVVEVNGPDGKPVEQTITKAANSIDTFAMAAEQADKKLNKAPLDSDAFKKAAKASKEATNAFDKAKESSMSFGDKLKAIPGPIGGMVQSVQGLSKALLASPIGIITLALGALFKAFTSTKKGTEMLAQVMAGLNAAMDVLRDLILPIGDALVSAFTNPKEAISELWEFIKQNFINRLQGVLEFLPAIGKAISQAFSLDFAGAAKTAADATAKIVLGVEDFTDKAGDMVDKIVEIAKEVKNEATAAAALTAQLQRVEDRQRALNVERANQNALIEEAKQRATDETLSYEERTKALEQAAAAEQNLLSKEIALAEDRLAAKRALAAQSDSDAATLDELASLEVGLANLRQQSAAKGKALQAEKKGLRDREKADIKALADFEKQLNLDLENDEKQRQQDALKNQQQAQYDQIDLLRTTEAEKARLKLLVDEKYLKDKQALEDTYAVEERAKAMSALDVKLELLSIKNKEDLDTLKSLLLQKMNLELVALNLTEDEKLLIIAKYEKAVKDIDDTKKAEDKAAADKKKTDREADLAAAAGALGAIGAQFEAGSKAAKGFAISEALINTYLGATKAYSSLVGIPIVGPALGAAAAAAAVVAGLKQVNLIKNTKEAKYPEPKFSQGGMVTGPGNGTSDSITAQVSNGESIINANATSMYSPLLSAINQAGGGKRFDSSGAMGGSQGVGNSGSPIIKTYVVANDVTTEQQLYRQQKSRSLV